MKKKVLIGYATFGSGHSSSAQYIKNYFEDKNKYEIMLINISSFGESNSNLNFKIFNKINKMPFFQNIFYGITNSKIISTKNEKMLIKCFDSQNLRKVISEFNPDIIICTHYIFSYLATYYNYEKIINALVLNVLIETSFHEGMISNKNGVSFYIVQNDMVKNKLLEHQVQESKIYSFGVPINSNSLLKIDSKEFILKKYSFKGDKPIYLFLSGKLGEDYVFDYFKALVKRNFPIDIIFVAGKNKGLKLKCENFIIKNDIKNVVILGFTNDIFNLLNVSEVVITKPSTSILNECVLMKKPCILLPSIKIQEISNANFMVKKHYALKVRSSKGLVKKINTCIKYPFIVNSIKNKLYKTKINDSVKKIYNLVDSVLSQK